MTRRQRALHAMLWPVLALVLAAVIGAGLWERSRAAEAARAVEAG